jgi:hypothetical protein
MNERLVHGLSCLSSSTEILFPNEMGEAMVRTVNEAAYEACRNAILDACAGYFL